MGMIGTVLARPEEVLAQPRHNPVPDHRKLHVLRTLRTANALVIRPRASGRPGSRHRVDINTARRNSTLCAWMCAAVCGRVASVRVFLSVLTSPRFKPSHTKNPPSGVFHSLCRRPTEFSAVGFSVVV